MHTFHSRTSRHRKRAGLPPAQAAGFAGRRAAAVAAAAALGGAAWLAVPASAAQAAPAPAQVTLPFTGLSELEGVAVDRAGDVYAADFGNSRVVELPAGSASSASQVTLPFTGLHGPVGVAVDQSGDVYATDTLNNRVVELPAGSASSASQVILPFTGLNEPIGVAVDQSGDVYAANFGNNQVVELVRHPDDDLAIAQPTNITTDATRPSGAAVSYPLPAVTDPDDTTPPAAACTPASGTTFAAGTTTVTCTATDPDDTNSPVTATFTITVRGAAAQLAALHHAVLRIRHDYPLARTVARAQRQLAAGHTRRACWTLTAFIYQVRSQEYWKIPRRTADRLIADARRIQHVLGC